MNLFDFKFLFSFFREPFFHLCVFSALYCCVGEGAGKGGGTDDALWKPELQFVAARREKGGGDLLFSS